MVQAARPDDASQLHARNALQKLCQMYWYPIYAYIRCRGHNEADAKDLTQAFFTRMLETDGFSTADRMKGRFRSFLLGAVKHFLVDEWRRTRAKKRGGDYQIVEWDAMNPETRYASVESVQAPEILFDKEWALETVNASLAALKEEMRIAGKEKQFQKLKVFLTGTGPGNRQALAEELGLNENALKVAIHRLRKRYRELLRSAVLETLESNDDLEMEMQYLISSLRS